MDLISNFTNKIAEQHAKQMEKIIEYKLKILSSMAYEKGEFELHSILENIDTSNIERTKMELAQKGYTLELEQPQYQLTNDENTFKATIDVGKIKLKVRKLILEV